VQEVTTLTFPQPANYFTIPDEEYDKLLKMLKQ
jgi:hypothetical protein